MGSVLKNMADARNKQKIKQIFKNFPNFTMNCRVFVAFKFLHNGNQIEIINAFTVLSSVCALLCW